MEAALEALLDAEMAGEDEEDEDDGDDDDGDDDDDGEGGAADGWQGVFYAPPSKTGGDSGRQRSAGSSDSHSKHEGKSSAGKGHNGELSDASATSTAPLNFSRVDTALSDEVLRQQFPLFVDARNRALEVSSQLGL